MARSPPTTEHTRSTPATQNGHKIPESRRSAARNQDHNSGLGNPVSGDRPLTWAFVRSHLPPCGRPIRPDRRSARDDRRSHGVGSTARRRGRRSAARPAIEGRHTGGMVVWSDCDRHPRRPRSRRRCGRPHRPGRSLRSDRDPPSIRQHPRVGRRGPRTAAKLAKIRTGRLVPARRREPRHERLRNRRAPQEHLESTVDRS